MEKIRATIHLTRHSEKGYGDGKFHKQRQSYDLTHQTPGSIEEWKNVMKYFAAHSRGEFEYWFTGDYTASSDDEECQKLIEEYEEVYK